MKAFLTAFNHLTWIKGIAEQCVRLGLDPIIRDNGSTYQPLLDWYDFDCPYDFELIGENHNSQGFWNSGRNKQEKEWFILSDHDLDLSMVPTDVVWRMKEAMDRSPEITKAGLSLEIDDLPDCYPFKAEVHHWEDNYWLNPLPGGFHADIDTTFALYDPARYDTKQRHYDGVRLDRPYTARHLPWYQCPETMTEEDRYFYSRAEGGLTHWSPKMRKFLQDREGKVMV